MSLPHRAVVVIFCGVNSGDEQVSGFVMFLDVTGAVEGGGDDDGLHLRLVDCHLNKNKP